MQVKPSESHEKSPRRSSWSKRLLFAGALVGLVIAWGADRQAADATRPVEWVRSSTGSSEPPRTDVLRIATYNIHGGKGRDQKLDLRRISDDLRGIDVAGLYEVHQPMFDAQSEIIGELAGLHAAFLGTERRWWHDHFGNAILTKLPIEQIHRIPLPGTRGKAFRQAVLFDVPLDDAIVHVLMAHVDSAQDRDTQLAAVIRLFESLAAPALLMGDLNSPPDHPRLRELLSHPGVENVLNQLGDAAPKNHIDWMITHGLECVDAEYLDSGASDHPVIKATLRMAR